MSETYQKRRRELRAFGVIGNRWSRGIHGNWSAITESNAGIDEELTYKEALPLSYESIFEAVQQGDTSKVLALLAEGFNPNIRDHQGRTPLMHAVLNVSDERALPLIQTLIEYGARVDLQDGEGMTALLLAVAKQRARPVVRVLAREFNAQS